MAYSDWDDYLIHQAPTTLDHVQDSDPSWTDRFFFSCHPRDGSAMLVCGYGVFPNRQVGSGYAKLALADGRHWDLSANRQCVHDRQEPYAGPLKFTVLEPRRRWRLQCGPNPPGLEFDIEYEARAPIWELKPVFSRKRGKVIINQQHIQQSANYSGWIKVDGETLMVDGFYGSRDRTWGIRNYAEIDMWIWVAAQFDDRALAAWMCEQKDGSIIYADGGICHEDGTVSRPFVRMEHRIEFDEGLKRPQSADILFVDEDGRRYEVRAVAEHPHVNTYHGSLLNQTGDLVQGQRWNENDRSVLKRVESLSMVSDQLMRYELDGQTGYGVLELLVSGDGYDPYAANWPRPTRG